MLLPITFEQGSALRRYFDDLGYGEALFRARPALRELPSRSTGNAPNLIYETREPTPQNTLIRLFVLGQAVPVAALSAQAPPEILEILAASNAVRINGNHVEPAITIVPLDRYLVAADLLSSAESNADGLILWPNQTTRLLYLSLLRMPAASTLDLGCGSGIFAVAASDFSQTVLATDLNPRAEAFTRFNAALNGVANVSTATGDGFEPVGDRAFDRIISNPPFFITPSSSMMYCENALDLDLFCRKVAIEGGKRLNEGGILQMLFEWVQIAGQPWNERLAEWVDGTGCDTWIVRTYEAPAAEYAHERTKADYAANPAQGSARFEELVGYYNKRGVEKIYGGMIAMRKRSGSNWLRIDEASFNPTEPFGHLFAEVFNNHDVLSSTKGAHGIMDRKPRLAPDTRLDQVAHVTGGQWRTTSLNLVRTGPFPVSIPLEPSVADFIAMLDGETDLASLTYELATRVNAPLAVVREQCGKAVRRLAERRLILL